MGFAEAGELALIGMYYTTQVPMRFLKMRVIEVLGEVYGDVEGWKFPFVRIGFLVEDDEPILEVVFLNYYPKKGVWQGLVWVFCWLIVFS